MSRKDQVLDLVAGEPGLRVGEIAERIGAPATYIDSVVEWLEAEGGLVRTQPVHPGRGLVAWRIPDQQQMERRA
jgi:DNA-binding IclR family transcriptional regulator